MAEDRRHFRTSQQEVQLRAQQRGVEMEELRKAVDSITSSALTAADDFNRACDEHIRSYVHAVEKRRSEVREEIKAQQGAAVRQADWLAHCLGKELTELKRKDTELEQLAQRTPYLLQSFQSLGDLPGPKASSTSVGTVIKLISEQKDKLENMCKEETGKMLNSLLLEKIIMVNENPPLHPRKEIKTRRNIRSSCYSKVELDPNTVCACLHLSNGNTEISWGGQAQCHPDHPDRFNYYYQALGGEGLSGTCYWEVEWSGGVVEVAVSYRGIGRKGWGNDCGFGHNAQSWSLTCSPSGYSFWHDKMNKQMPVPCSSRVGVYLEHSSGTLSFYSVSDLGAMNVLHRVQTVFTEPLYPGFSVDLGATLTICQLV